MIVKRTTVSGGSGFVQLEIFVAECEGCPFSAVSRYEGDAVAIVERHQSNCRAWLAAKAASSSDLAAKNAAGSDKAKDSTTDRDAKRSAAPKRTVA